MNLENTKVYTTNEDVIRKYAKLCGVEVEPIRSSAIGYYFPIRCNRIYYFISGSCVDTDHEYTEMTESQINALYNEDFGIKAETQEKREGLDATAQVDSEEWDGEGLPPVGVECELSNCGNGWQKAKVLFVGTGLCVVDHGYGDQHYHLNSVKFRKPETPQQREERERLEAIETMCNEVDRLPHGEAFAAMAMLYDLGYRKEK